MKVLTLIAVLLPLGSFAQTAVRQSIPVRPGQSVEMKFDFPNRVIVSTWDQPEVSVTGTVSINNGENDDAFTLELTSNGNQVFVGNTIKNMKNLPHRITVKKGDQKMTFKSRKEYKEYASQFGNSFDMMNESVDIDILLEIKVPANTQTAITCTYGMLEVKNFNGPLQATATYGGLDATVAEQSVGELLAETRFGHIYSNLTTDLRSDPAKEEDFHLVVKARPGKGPAYQLASAYGNVYLRKP